MDYLENQTIQFGVRGLEAVERSTKVLDAEATAAKRAQASVDDLAKGKRNLGQAALESSRALQDFAQGGLGGILNNAEGVVRALGYGPGLAGAATVLAVAFWALKDPVANFISALANGGEKIPKTTDALEDLASRLKEGKEALEGIAASWGGTTEEVERYNAQLAANVDLEKAANAERERRKAIEEEAAGGKPAAGAAEAAQKAIAAGGGFDATSAGARDRINETDSEIAKLRAQQKGLRKQLSEGYASVPNFTGEHLHGQVADLQAQINARMGVNNTTAVDLVARARQGETTAIGQLAGLLPGGGFNAATPLGLANAKEAQETAKRQAQEVEAEQKRRADAKKADDKSRAEAAEKQRRTIESWQKANDRDGDDLERANDRNRRERKQQQDRQTREAAAAARRAPREAQQAQDAREGAQLQGIAAREYGITLGEDQTQTVLRQARQYLDAGADPSRAARASIEELIQVNQQLMQRMQASEASFQAISSQMAAQRMQFQPGAATGGIGFGTPRLFP